MQTRYFLILAGSLLFSMPPAQAAVDMANGDALAKASNCLACHAVDHKVLGPSYQDVAKKYKGDKEAEARLVKKVKGGGAGVWGPIPMPPNGPKVSDANIQTLVEWVLAH